MTQANARRLCENVYCARADLKNRIREQQLMRFADRTSAATLRANQLRLYCPSVAYVLLAALRRLGLGGPVPWAQRRPSGAAAPPQGEPVRSG